MELGIVIIILALVGSFVWHSAHADRRRERDQRQRREESDRQDRQMERQIEREERERWEFTDKRGGMLTRWQIDFPSMRLTVVISSVDAGTSGSKSRVRRVSGTQWERRETEDSRRAAIATLEHEMSENESLREAYEEVLAVQKKPAAWCPIDEEHVPSIETAYQRYVRASTSRRS